MVHIATQNNFLLVKIKSQIGKPHFVEFLLVTNAKLANNLKIDHNGMFYV